MVVKNTRALVYTIKKYHYMLLSREIKNKITNTVQLMVFPTVLHREHTRRGKNGGWKRERDGECEEEGG